jgi:hypothetical protein
MTRGHLLRDKRGVSAVEFAMLAPVLLMLICGTIDLGYVYMAQSSLTGAVARAARASVAKQEETQTARDTAMRAAITNTMSDYQPVPGGEVAIESRVYDDFDGARPEPYQDTVANGRYDPPSGTFPGEPFTDRNGNGVRDLETRYKDGTTGETGDVVRYTATYTVQHLFGFISAWNGEPGVHLSATSVVRNEPVKTE